MPSLWLTPIRAFCADSLRAALPHPVDLKFKEIKLEFKIKLIKIMFKFEHE